MAKKAKSLAAEFLERESDKKRGSSRVYVIWYICEWFESLSYLSIPDNAASVALQLLKKEDTSDVFQLFGWNQEREDEHREAAKVGKYVFQT